MIEAIRNQMQKKGSKLFVWIMLFIFAGSSLIGLVSFSSRFKGTSIATVNGNQDIEIKEFQRQHASIVEQINYIRKLVGANADDFLKQFGFNRNPEEIALEALLAQKAEQSAARSLGTKVSNDYLQAKLRDPYFVKEFLSEIVPPQVISGSVINAEALRNFLNSQGITETQFEEMLQEIMERLLFRRLVMGAEYIPLSVVKEAYEADSLKKKYGIATLSLDEYLKKAEAKKPSEDALKAYFEGNKENYRIPEKRSARIWTFDPESYGLTVTDKELRDAYEKRKKIFVDKPEEYQVQHIVLKFTEANKNDMRMKGQEIVKEIKAHPDRFNELTLKHSEAKEKTDSFTVKKGEKGAMYERYVFGLAQGEISPVIETPDGFEIIKLVQKKEQTYKPFEEVKNQLSRSVKQEKFNTEFAATAQRIVRQSQDVPTALTTFVKDKKGHETVVGDLESDKTQKAQKLFSLKNSGDKAFVAEGGKGFIIELKDITQSRIADFKSVQDKVAKDYNHHEALKALEADSTALAARVKDNKESLEKAAAAFKANYVATDWVTPHDQAFTKRSIPPQKVKELKRVHEVISGVEGKAGFVVQVLEKEPFVQKDFDEKKASLRTEIARTQEGELIRATLDALKKNAEVVFHIDMTRSSRPRR